MKILGYNGNITISIWRIITYLVFTRTLGIKEGDSLSVENRFLAAVFGITNYDKQFKNGFRGLSGVELLLDDGRSYPFVSNVVHERYTHTVVAGKGLEFFWQMAGALSSIDAVKSFNSACSYAFYYYFLTAGTDNSIILDADDLFRIYGDGYLRNGKIEWANYKRRVLKTMAAEINQNNGSVTGMHVDWSSYKPNIGHCATVAIKFAISSRRRLVADDSRKEIKAEKAVQTCIVPSDAEKYVGVAVNNGFRFKEGAGLIAYYGSDRFIASVRYAYLSDKVTGMIYRRACVLNGWSEDYNVSAYTLKSLSTNMLPFGVYESYLEFLKSLPYGVLVFLLQHIGKVYRYNKPVLYDLMTKNGLSILENKSFAVLMIEAVRDLALENEIFCDKLKVIAKKYTDLEPDFFRFGDSMPYFSVSIVKKLRHCGILERKWFEALKGCSETGISANLEYYLNNVVCYRFTENFVEMLIDFIKKDAIKYDGVPILDFEENESSGNIFDDDVKLPSEEIDNFADYIHLRNKFNMFSSAVKLEMIGEANRLIGNEAMTENMKEFEYWENEETAKVLAGVLRKYLNNLCEV